MLLVTGCGGGSDSGSAGQTYTTGSTASAKSSTGSPGPGGDTTSPPNAGTTVSVTSANGFIYQMSATPFVMAPVVTFDEPSIGKQVAPPDTAFVTVMVTVVNATDQPEPLFDAEGWVFDVPEAMLQQLGPVDSQRLVCPADYELPAGTCTLPAREASVRPEPDIGDEELAPGASVTLLVSTDAPVTSALHLDGFRLYNVTPLTGTSGVEVPVPAA